MRKANRFRQNTMQKCESKYFGVYFKKNVGGFKIESTIMK